MLCHGFLSGDVVASARTTVMIPGARANSLSFLLVSFVWLVLSPFWERCWLWCWRWNLLHLLRRLSLRLLRLRPVLLCRRSGPIRLHGLLTAWRRPAWPVVSRRRRSRTRLRHYVGWRRILPLGVSVGRRRTRPCDLRRPPAILAPAGVRGRLILPIVDHGRWSGVGLLHYVGRRRTRPCDLRRRPAILAPPGVRGRLILPIVDHGRWSGVGLRHSGGRRRTRPCDLRRPPAILASAGVRGRLILPIVDHGRWSGAGLLLYVGRRRTRPCDLRRPPAILAPAGVRGRLILPIVDHGRWSGVGLLHYVGRRRTRPCDLRRPSAILAPAGVRGRLILPIVDHGRWSGVGLLHYVGRRSGVRLPLCIWRLRVRRAGPPGGGIHLAHTLLWSGANRRLNA